MKPYWSGDGITLYHGNCLEVPAWVAADVLICDPPYGVPGGRLSKHTGGLRPVHADAKWDTLAVRDAALEKWGDRPRAIFATPGTSGAISHRGVPLIWEKGDDPGMGDPLWPFGPSYELIYVSGQGWKGKRRPSVLKVHRSNRDAALIGHPTPKPVPLMELLVSYAPPGTIADPFAGSGSTLVAAKLQGRKAIGVELEERFCEIAARRLDQGVMEFPA